MAFVSFTLRRSVIDRGSYARYDADTFGAAASAGNAASAGTWIYEDARDTDQYLKSDQYQIPPNTFVESFIEATSPTYGIVELNWELPLQEVSEDTVATQGVLVYSSTGIPATVGSGVVLSQSSNNFSYEHTGLPQGRWAYYSLFVRYQSTLGVDFYEKVADIEVLVPYNYGSTLELWNRIPEYYRRLDTSIGEYVDPESYEATTVLGTLPVGNVVGPLYRFLSIFGFEVDRLRTIIDYVMVSKDPAEANSETLNAVANAVGLGYTTSSVSAERLRALLDDIGYLRRAKGTNDGVSLYGRALAASNLDVDQDTRSIKFYAQRVNYVTDPEDATGLVTHRPAHESEAQMPTDNMGVYDPSTYVEGDTGTYPPTFSDGNYTPGMYWTSASAGSFLGIPVDVGDYIVAYAKNGSVKFGVSGYTFDADNYSTYSTYTNAGVSYTPNGTGASAGVTHTLFHLSSPVAVRAGDNVAFSVHSAVGTSALVAARLVNADGEVVGFSNKHTYSRDVKAIEVTASNNLDVNQWNIVFVEFLIDLESVSTYELKYLLVERNRIGNYFDGSFANGGWISNPAGTARTGDYNWSSEGENSGNPFDSISVYTEDYQRTRSVLSNVFNFLLPVTLTDYYTVTSYNAIPGMDAIDAYLTGP